jgi:hypothetical protein
MPCFPGSGILSRSSTFLSNRPAVQVLLVSAEPGRRHLGGSFLQKPFTPEALIAAVRAPSFESNGRLSAGSVLNPRVTAVLSSST